MSTGGGGPNGALPKWQKLATETRRLDPRGLKPQELNARYMTKRQFGQLVENIKTDGRLTGAITCYQSTPDQPVEILSGHHRAEAAIAAGLDEVDCIVITSPLDAQRKAAIQLSHNAITGQDDLSALGEMYMSLDLSAKKFSGLDDDLFGGFDKVNLSGLSAGSVKYQEITLHFLPEDLKEIEASLAEMVKAKGVHHVAAIESFAAFFEAIVRTKNLKNVLNSAVALDIMVKLATERLDQLNPRTAAVETERQSHEA